MSLKKYISGISALAVAATAFASMAVTASAATEYKDIAVTPVAQNNMTDNGDGTFTSTAAAASGYALALADFSNLTDIDKATTITIDFKTAIGNSRMAFCLGDKSQRGTNAAGSTGTSFKYDGVAMFFGSLGSNSYKINNAGDNLASSAFNKTVKVHILINRENGKLYYRLTDASNNKLAENTTGISPYNNKAKTVDIIEAYTWASGVKAQFTDVKVTYTVPMKVEASVEEKDAFTVAGGYDKDMVVGKLHVTVKNGTYDLKGAKYNQIQGTVTDTDGNTPAKTEITGDANGTSVVVFAVLKDVNDVAELNNIVFE